MHTGHKSQHQDNTCSTYHLFCLEIQESQHSNVSILFYIQTLSIPQPEMLIDPSYQYEA